MDERYFHIFSDGSKSDDLFPNDISIIKAVNRIAVLAFQEGITILGYDAEDTHLHILAKGERARCARFCYRYQKQTRRDISDSHTGNVGMTFELSMVEIDSSEYLHNVGIYVISQSTKDGKKIMPYDYKWSSAALYFRGDQKDYLWTHDKNGIELPVIEMSQIAVRNRKKLFCTHSSLPGNWRVCDGLILPSSFVDIGGFEAIYRTHNAFRVFSGSSRDKDNVILRAMAEIRGVTLNENEAREICSTQCLQMFGRKDVRLLRVDQRLELAMVIRKKCGMCISQLSRRVHLPEQELRKYLK